MKYLSFLIMFVVLCISTADARTILVGPTRTYKTPCAAAGAVVAGDTVVVDTGLYIDQACSWSASNTLLRGAGKFAHLKAPGVIPNQKAILVVTGNNVVIENIEFSNASVPDQNGAGIRLEGKNVTIRNCYFHHCEDGILGGSGTVLVEQSEFAFCGYGDGYSHNMYISACDTFTLRFCYTHDTREGHTVKSRAFRNYILYNLITSDTSTTSYEINLPNAGTSFVIGNLIQQGTNSHNGSIIDYGSEGLSGHDTSLYVVNNTIVNDRSSGTFISVSSTNNRPVVYNNLFIGNGTICSRQMDSAGNISTNSPAFMDRVNFNYHLTAVSPGIDKGKVNGSAKGFSLTPQFQFVAGCTSVSRPITGAAIDAGAYEYSSSSVKTSFVTSVNKSHPVAKTAFNLTSDLLGRVQQPHANDIRFKKSRVGPLITVNKK